MELAIREENGVTVVVVEGGIVQEGVEDFKKLLLDLLDRGKLKLVLDMEKCGYVTSMSLAAIFTSKKRFKESGGDIRIARINRLIRNLFELTNLRRAADIFETVEEAVRSFSAAPGTDEKVAGEN